MISRKSTRIIADLYTNIFVLPLAPIDALIKNRNRVRWEELYNFLYDRDYAPEFLKRLEDALRTLEPLDRFIKRIHTGESLNLLTVNWDETRKKEFSQLLLRLLATDGLNEINSRPEPFLIDEATYQDHSGTWNASKVINEAALRPFKLAAQLTGQLAIDGYVFRNGKLFQSESTVIPEQEEQSLLSELVNKVQIGNKDVILNHLELSEEHYVNKRWGDSISNARSFLEECLNQTARFIHKRKKVPQKFPPSAEGVRTFLVNHRFLDQKEKEVVEKLYGFMSDRGSHPNIAEEDEARLMRHMALSFSQYILLKLESYMRDG